jgi:predicted sugar kinase
MNPVNSGSVPATTDRVHATIGRVHATIGRVPGTVGMMREEIAVEYHTCLMPCRAKPVTSDMFHRWIKHVRWSET